MRFSWLMCMVIACFAAGATANDCDSIRKDGGKYYCGELQLKTKTDFQSALASNQEALDTYNGATGLGLASYIFSEIGGGCLGYGLVRMLLSNDPVAPTVMGIGGGIVVIGLGMAIGSGIKIKKSIQIYNNGKKSKSPSSIKLDIYPGAAKLTMFF